MKVYVLGAGASAEDGAPVTRELIDKAFWSFGGKSTSSDRHLWGVTTDEKELSVFRSVFRLYDHFYGTRLEDKMRDMYRTCIHPSGLFEDAADRIEDFFTRMDKMVNGKEDYGLNWDEGRVAQIAKDAGYFFYHTLCLATLSRKRGPPKHYLAFVENALLPGIEHCIITFNYDLLLENALLDADLYFNNGYDNPLLNKNYSDPPRHFWTYAVPFTFVDSKFLYYRVSDENTADIYCLKLHGSLNWGLCPATQETLLYVPAMGVNTYRDFYEEKKRCHAGEHITQPLLIPPTTIKDLTIPGLRVIWEKARESLREATEIHILGYSLPDADIGARNLLSENKRKLKRLVIANPDMTHRNRLKSIMGKGASEICEYPSFKEYLIGEYEVQL